jgi:hypothetical protein
MKNKLIYLFTDARVRNKQKTDFFLFRWEIEKYVNA